MHESRRSDCMNRCRFLVVSLIAVTVNARGEQVEIDFLEGRLNGKRWDSLNIDSVVDILGRPEKTRAARVIKYGFKEGARLSYEAKGLSLYFEHPLVNSNQTLA